VRTTIVHQILCRKGEKTTEGMEGLLQWIMHHMMKHLVVGREDQGGWYLYAKLWLIHECKVEGESICPFLYVAFDTGWYCWSIYHWNHVEWESVFILCRLKLGSWHTASLFCFSFTAEVSSLYKKTYFPLLKVWTKWIPYLKVLTWWEWGITLIVCLLKQLLKY